MHTASQSRPIVMPFYVFYKGGGRLIPCIYDILQINSTMILFYILFEGVGRFIPCCCVSCTLYLFIYLSLSLSLPPAQSCPVLPCLFVYLNARSHSVHTQMVNGVLQLIPYSHFQHFLVMVPFLMFNRRHTPWILGKHPTGHCQAASRRTSSVHPWARQKRNKKPQMPP